MFNIVKWDIQKVTIKYIAVKISHLQTENYWNITPNIIQLLKYLTVYVQNIYRITLIHDCQNITHKKN
jgi:hypothetical protein